MRSTWLGRLFVKLLRPVTRIELSTGVVRNQQGQSLPQIKRSQGLLVSACLHRWPGWHGHVIYLYLLQWSCVEWMRFLVDVVLLRGRLRLSAHIAVQFL